MSVAPEQQTAAFGWPLWIIWAVTAVAVGLTLFASPIAQDLAYHDFADQRELLGVLNFWNTLSNLPFLLVGIAGIVVCLREPAGLLAELKTPCLIFFIGVSFVAFGSGWYHLYPSNTTLVWDRLPMTLGFMAFFSVLVGENISLPVAEKLLWPLLILGVFSVFYWSYTESQGRGDLRLYALVQFLPMLLIPLILLLFRSPFTGNRWLWFALLAYAGSKVTEFFDGPIYSVLGLSGHSIKHVLAALGALFFLRALQKRVPVAEQ